MLIYVMNLEFSPAHAFSVISVAQWLIMQQDLRIALPDGGAHEIGKDHPCDNIRIGTLRGDNQRMLAVPFGANDNCTLTSGNAVERVMFTHGLQLYSNLFLIEARFINNSFTAFGKAFVNLMKLIVVLSEFAKKVFVRFSF